MASLRYTPTLPKKPVLNPAPQQTINKFLRDYAFKFIGRMQDYPQMQPWKRPPKTGLRSGGRRTGTYGKGWGVAPKFTQNSVQMENHVPYAVYVGGPKDKRPGQTQVMKSRGWPSVSDVGPQLAEEMAPELQKALS